MYTYWTMFVIKLKEYFMYRLNFVLWRFRAVLSTLITVYLWLAVFDAHTSFGTYSKMQMLSYILYTGLMSTFIASSRTSQLAGEIQSGDLMNLLLKPLAIFRTYAVYDLVDKAANGIFGIVEFALIVFFLHIPLVPAQFSFLFVYFALCGMIISFFINLMLSFLGFWSNETWAPRFLFMMLVSFVSGTYFPLDLLPPLVFRILLLTPFPYMFYLPGKILMNGAQSPYIVQQVIMALLWTGGIYGTATVMWKKGLHDFSFWGK